MTLAVWIGVMPRLENGGVDLADLTEAEQLLWKAFPHGAWVDLGHAEGVGTSEVRADVIVALLLCAIQPEPGRAAGVRLRGATVRGRLDLAGGTVGWPVDFDDCRFDSGIGFVDSSVRTVAITNCELPGFDGTRLRLEGILDLAGSAVAGTIRLEHAKVSGQLRLRGTRAGTVGASEAVVAEGLSADGDADCAGLNAHGLVSLEGADVTGGLDLSRVLISRPGGRGLNLDYATIGGRLSCDGLEVDGETRASNCRIGGELASPGARLCNPGGIAFFAGGLDVGGGVFFTDGLDVRGEFRLIGARMAANLSIEGATFDNPGGVAVNLEHASVRTLNADGLSCTGQLNLAGADISRDANLAGAVLETGGGMAALNAERAQIGGTFVLRNVTALGEVNLQSTRVGERLLLMDAEMRTPSGTGTACRLTRAQVTADLFCDRMIVEGELRLAGTAVGGVIALEGARLLNAAGNALYARSLQALSLRLRPAAIKGGVDLRYAAVSTLHDDPDSWPLQLHLEGLGYQALDPPLSARRRLDWLDRDPRGHQPQPYEQLAAHYSAIGQQAQARDVLYARERIQRRVKGPVARAWSLLQDVTVGYGYRPRRALGWLALLLVTGSIVFSVAPPPPLQPGAAPHFNGIVYTLDLMLPVVNLGQKYSFNPGGAEQWLSYFLMAAGWILATTVAAGGARVLRRG